MLSDYLWLRSRPTRAQIRAVADFCLRAVRAGGAPGSSDARRQRTGQPAHRARRAR
jgi:hypothetical protein